MIAITDYNEAWPKWFSEIRDCLYTELADEVGAFAVEHIGSTAVPGLVARPLLDLCVVVSEASDMPSLMGGLERLGYIHQEVQGGPGLEAFRRRGPDVPFLEHKRDFSPHNLYASIGGTRELGNCLTFRDHLNHDADDRTAYAKIKSDLAPHADADQYSQAKARFIEAVLARMDG